MQVKTVKLAGEIAEVDIAKILRKNAPKRLKIAGLGWCVEIQRPRLSHNIKSRGHLPKIHGYFRQQQNRGKQRGNEIASSWRNRLGKMTSNRELRRRIDDIPATVRTRACNFLQKNLNDTKLVMNSAHRVNKPIHSLARTDIQQQRQGHGKHKEIARHNSEK